MHGFHTVNTVVLSIYLGSRKFESSILAANRGMVHKMCIGGEVTRRDWMPASKIQNQACQSLRCTDPDHSPDVQLPTGFVRRYHLQAREHRKGDQLAGFFDPVVVNSHSSIIKLVPRFRPSVGILAAQTTKSQSVVKEILDEFRDTFFPDLHPILFRLTG